MVKRRQASRVNEENLKSDHHECILTIMPGLPKPLFTFLTQCMHECQMFVGGGM